MSNKKIIFMKQKLHSLLLMVVLLSWSMVIAASDFDDGILKYTITSPSNLEVQCDGFTDAHKNDESVVIPETVNYNNRTYAILTVKGFGNSKLSSVKLPQSLKTIGNMAFDGCSNLKEIEIPYGIISNFSGFMPSKIPAVKCPNSWITIKEVKINKLINCPVNKKDNTSI